MFADGYFYGQVTPKSGKISDFSSNGLLIHIGCCDDDEDKPVPLGEGRKICSFGFVNPLADLFSHTSADHYQRKVIQCPVAGT